MTVEANQEFGLFFAPLSDSPMIADGADFGPAGSSIHDKTQRRLIERRISPENHISIGAMMLSPGRIYLWLRSSEITEKEYLR